MQNRHLLYQEVESIVRAAWQTAARINPMCLVRLRQDYDFDRLRQMIRDCLDKGLSPTEIEEEAVKELLRSAGAKRQPHDKCQGEGDILGEGP